jgi:hypothetical protein
MTKLQNLLNVSNSSKIFNTHDVISIASTQTLQPEEPSFIDKSVQSKFILNEEKQTKK